MIETKRVNKRGSARLKILELACLEFSQNGIRAASLNDILKRSELSKGAFYHHFKSKDDILVAVIDEFLTPWIVSKWIKPLKKRGKFISVLDAIIKYQARAKAVGELDLNRLFLNALSESYAFQEESKTKFSKLLNSLIISFYRALSLHMKEGRGHLQKRGWHQKTHIRTIAWLVLSSIFGGQLINQASNKRLDYLKSRKALKLLIPEILES